MAETENIGVEALADLMHDAFVASGVAGENAGPVAAALVAAEVDGRKGHGMSRVPGYAAQARSGKVNGTARPTARRRGSVLNIDACHGFAYPALDLAIAALPGMAREHGIAAAAITRSHHSGVAAHPVERLAQAGCLAISLGNTPKGMAPWGGTRAVFGTNPVAFAAPREEAEPIVVDMALTKVARGNILRAQQAGEDIPEGWACDGDGNPTTDPTVALNGTLAPIGGAKGAALALMVEILAVGLTGANPSVAATSFFDAEGAPPGVGQFFIALSADAFAGRAVFAERVEAIAAEIAGQEGTRLPGARVAALRDAAEARGLDVDAKMLGEVRLLAAGKF